MVGDEIFVLQERIQHIGTKNLQQRGHNIYRRTVALSIYLKIHI